MLAEEGLNGGDGGAAALDQRIAIARVGDRRLQHVAQSQRAEVAQDQHVGLERAGNARRQQPGARHDVEAQLVAIARNRGAGRGRALAADDDRLAALGVVEDDRHVAAGTAQMRLHHLQREGGRHPGVERVAAALQHAHADGGGDPVRGGDDAEGAVDLGPRREGA